MRIKFFLLLLVFIPALLCAQSPVVTVEKNGKTYRCQNIRGVWLAGKVRAQRFIAFKKLQRINLRLFRETGDRQYLRKSNKFKRLNLRGTVPCSHTCGNGVKDVSVGEQCDDENLVNNDSCTNSCQVNLITQIVAGDEHTCVLASSGDVKCWGDGEYGKLGYGNTDSIGDDEVPASVGFVDLGGTAIQLTAGFGHTCALLSTGEVRCWGLGLFGQLGYGNTENIGDNESPATAGSIDLGGTAIQISAGSTHTCALLDTGEVRCWGSGSYGKLGYGNTDTVGDNETPASIGSVDVGAVVTQIATGNSHTCVVLDNGKVRCWGFGISGALGYGNTDMVGDNETPASVGNVDIGDVVTQISTTDVHTCALLATGNTLCWGFGANGRLGYGNTDDIGDNETPLSVGTLDIGGTVQQIRASYSHSCALLDTGDVRCWGLGSNGHLGYGNLNNIGDNQTPSSAGSISLGGIATQITTGDSYSCALLNTGGVKCWGFGGSGQLGYGNTNDIGDDEVPASVGEVVVF